MDDKKEAIDVIAKWMCCGDKPDAAAKLEAERLYGRLHLIMAEIEYKEMRKLLNKAWDAADHRYVRTHFQYGLGCTDDAVKSARYRGVSRIIKEVKKKEQP